MRDGGWALSIACMLIDVNEETLWVMILLFSVYFSTFE